MSDLRFSQQLAELQRRVAELERVERASSEIVWWVHKNATNQTGLFSANYTKLTWPTEVLDPYGAFASDRYTPTRKGRYLSLLLVTYISAVDQKYVVPALYKNGALVAQTATRASGALDQAGLCIAAADCNGSSDYLEAYTYHDFGVNGTVSGGAASTYWIGIRI